MFPPRIHTKIISVCSSIIHQADNQTFGSFDNSQGTQDLSPCKILSSYSSNLQTKQKSLNCEPVRRLAPKAETANFPSKSTSLVEFHESAVLFYERLCYNLDFLTKLSQSLSLLQG